MPFPEHVFQHTPALRGLITPPDCSEMRFGLERFAELDQQAEEEGWPAGWRMDHDDREANRQAVLAGRWDQDLWVFAYGSLIWDPAVYVEEYRRGVLSGWRRSFCMLLEGGRGSHDRPGLMAALDEGGHCDGVVFRIREGHLRLLAIHQRDVGIRVERIAANQTVIPNRPNVASAACCRTIVFWCRNRFDLFYVTDPKVDVDFAGIKTGEFKIKIDVQIKDAVQLDREQVCIPCGVLGDLVVCEAIGPHLRLG